MRWCKWGLMVIQQSMPDYQAQANDLSNTGYPVADDQIVVEIDSPNPDEVISNMEGGQYAKTENLLRTKEPETFDAIKYGTTAKNICNVTAY